MIDLWRKHTPQAVLASVERGGLLEEALLSRHDKEPLGRDWGKSTAGRANSSGRC